MSDSCEKSGEPGRLVEDQENDLVWGAAEIGRVIGRSADQVRYLHKIGVLEGAVTKVSHKIFMGSRGKLHSLAAIKKPTSS